MCARVAGTSEIFIKKFFMQVKAYVFVRLGKIQLTLSLQLFSEYPRIEKGVEKWPGRKITHVHMIPFFTLHKSFYISGLDWSYKENWV